MLPEHLYHRPCGELLEPKLVCVACSEEPLPETLSVRTAVGYFEWVPPAGRRARIANELQTRGENFLATVVLGDGWSLMVLNAVMRGLSTFDAIHKDLTISSNVLSARLKTLMLLELLQQRQSEQDRRVFYYSATEKGFNVFPIIVALRQWGDRWLAERTGPRSYLPTRHAVPSRGSE